MSLLHDADKIKDIIFCNIDFYFFMILYIETRYDYCYLIYNKIYIKLRVRQMKVRDINEHKMNSDVT